MKEVYNIDFGLEYYFCMVDFFGRKGKFEEVFEFICSMLCKFDVGIWGVLFSVLKIYCNVKVVE